MPEQKLTVEDCLKELREMFGSHPQIIVGIRDCGEETTWRGKSRECYAQIGLNGTDLSGPTFKEVMAQVRAWHKEQST